MDPAADSARRRLVWRCRRGMKELDLLLTGYLNDSWESAAQDERVAFERILELPDPVIAAYLLQRDEPADPHIRALVEILRGRAAARQPTVSSAAATPVQREP